MTLIDRAVLTKTENNDFNIKESTFRLAFWNYHGKPNHHNVTDEKKYLFRQRFQSTDATYVINCRDCGVFKAELCC